MNRKQSPLISQLKTQVFNVWGACSHAFGQPYEYILMLASARSGSTLLAHILTSNPEIFGMGESKITLTGKQGYRQLTGKNLYYHRRNDLPRNGEERYILDKLVHNSLLDPQEAGWLNNPRVRVIFLLRDPVPTLTSFMRVVKVDEKVALDYFISRTDYLAQYAQSLAPDKTSVFLTYTNLLECTKPALNLLQEYLELQEPLSEQYQVTNITGAFGLGDKSENIKSGRIVAATKAPINQLTPKTLTTAQEAYDRCAAILKENCLTIAPEKGSDQN